jgi:hypothetical protein
MDELEACVFLSRQHASRITGSDTDHVLVCGGAKGVLRLFVVRYHAHNSRTKKTKEASSFECLPLMVMAITGEHSSFRTYIPPIIDGQVSSVSLSKKSNDSVGEIHGILNLMYLPDRKHSQIVAVTSDQTFCCFEIATGSEDDPSSDSDENSRVEEKDGTPSLVLSRQLVGTHDDILDICCMPTRNGAHKDYLLAIASNSPHIRLTNMLTDGSDIAHESTSILLYGHSDIVLALDGSPDGYVSLISS